MKTLSITIMAHPARAALIPALQKAIGGKVPVVFDEIENIWDTCRRAWLAHDMKADYGLVIQDDAIVCKGFRKKALAILNAQEKPYLTAFYAGGLAENSVKSAMRQGKDHFIAGSIFNEVALCLPTNEIKNMVHFCDEREAQNDHLIQQWAHLRRIKIWYPVPSLVDHRAEVPSLYRAMHGKPEAKKPRVATAFIDTYEKP